MYCKYDAPHPSTPPSDWSSKDWNGDKAKTREQCSLLDFDKLEQQLKQTLQNSALNTLLETLHNKMPDEKLMEDFRVMTLKEGKNGPDLPDKQTDKSESLDDSKKKKEGRHKSPPLEFVMTEQEKKMQEEEEKYNIYMSTFGYEGDDLDLDSKTDTDSEGHAYPFLD